MEEKYTKKEVDKIVKLVTEELSEWAKVMIKDAVKHQTPSQETKEEIEKLNVAINSLGCNIHKSRVDRIERAIFGDKDDETDKGIKCQLEDIKRDLSEISLFFRGTKGSAKLLVWIFYFLSVMVAGGFALKKIFKFLSN